ncbi:Major facilitator superfamily domain-containing protein 7 [Cyphellophora attinorum]|uniref:Major facilitator superfamily domain-containing protein 7 n=1 Tax=Cyphellophora attinorum TaxID=1664694 RepID=A0A0N0NQ75_9EURO|nr:Major facilitator superfamily domain-containing protein 7 [Phialophora attinorum]KPI43581.1 Major facilitator superfamily domain-containing protein 7 [Phialophora attinorum]
MFSKTPKVNERESATSSSSHAAVDRNGASPPAQRESHDRLPPLDRTLSRLTTASTVEYRVYKRRWLGLVQLALLNIVISWDWITFAAVSSSAATYFSTSETNINWASTAFLFAFVVATPFTSWTLHRHGPKLSIMAAAVLTLVGNGIKYGGTASHQLGVMMLGQMVIGVAQPFALSSATSYSNLWFTPSGQQPHHISRLVGFVAIISASVSAFSLFVPGQPPTPPSAASASTSHITGPYPNEDSNGNPLNSKSSLLKDLHTLTHSLEFYLIFLPFTVYVGFFNAFSSLINQILEPYSFSEDNAGIAGAILIVVGLLTAAVSSPIIDRTHAYLTMIRICVPLIAIAYVVLIFAPPTKSLAFVFVVCAALGAASFGLVPVALEFLVEMHYPLGPELGSSLCWCGGQLLGGIFIVIMDKLKGGIGGPEDNMQRALIFQAVIAVAVAPLPVCLGLFGRGDKVRRRRWEVDREGAGSGEVRVEDGEEDQERLRGSGSLRI